MSKRKWTPTCWRRPKLGRDVLGWYGDVGYVVVAREDDGRYYDDTGGEFGPPTHWFKLPKPPKPPKAGRADA
jgi:hypothetical protein